MRLRKEIRGARRRLGIRSRFLLSGVVVASLAATLSVPVSASTANTKRCVTANGVRVKDSSVCKGLAFYKGKTMTSYNIASIGGPFYDLVVAAQPYVAQYLGANVNILSITTGNSVPGQDSLAHATPDGLTYGVLNVLNDVSLVLTNTPGINFNPARLAYLAATGVASSPLLTLPTSGYHTFADLIAASKAGTLKVLTQTTGTANTILRTWFGIMGIKPQWISGYSSLSVENTGFLRNDGPIADISLSTSCGNIVANQEVPIAVNLIPPVGTNCRKFLLNVPTFKDLEKQYPPKTKKEKTLWATLFALSAASGTPFVTQTGVAGYKVDTLRAALKWTYAQPGFKSAMLAFGLNPTYTDPVVAKFNYINSIKNGASIVCYIQATCS